MKQQKITASAFIYHNKKVLLVKRADSETFAPNHWELPGGHMEFGEAIEEGLLRECIEEVGFSVNIKNTFHSFTFITDNDMTHYIENINLCAPKSSHPAVTLNPKEHSDYKWIKSKEELDELDMFFEEKNAVIKGFELVLSTPLGWE